MTKKKIAILGAGNGGCAAAADMRLKGYEVGLYDLFPSTLTKICEQGGLYYSGVIGEGFVTVKGASSDLGQAVKDADLIMLTVPGPGHRAYAEALLPYLKPNDIVLLNPGHTGGALRFTQLLKEMGAPQGLIICETNTLSYISRLECSGRVIVSSYEKPVMFSVIPGKRQGEAAAAVQSFFPAMVPVDSVFQTTLSNLNAIFHPPGMVLNAGWLENTNGNFRFYYDGITPAIGSVIDSLDAERLAIGKALGVELMAFPRLLYSMDSTTEQAAVSGSAYIACHESAPNRFIKAPETLDDRYMHEDIHSGIGPIAYLGRMAGVPTPTMDALINLACFIMGRDYWRDAINLHQMGLAGKSIAEAKAYTYAGY